MGRRLKKKTAKGSKRSTARPGNPRKKLIKSLDSAVSEAVRKHGKCEKCGATSSLQAHHAFGRKNMATRWLMLNMTCLCYPHHLHWAHRDILGFATWFENKIGKENYEYLKKVANTTVKWTDQELEQLLKEISSTKRKNESSNGNV